MGLNFKLLRVIDNPQNIYKNHKNPYKVLTSIEYCLKDNCILSH